jgi:hypothetical protein
VVQGNPDAYCVPRLEGKKAWQSVGVGNLQGKPSLPATGLFGRGGDDCQMGGTRDNRIGRRAFRECEA